MQLQKLKDKILSMTGIDELINFLISDITIFFFRIYKCHVVIHEIEIWIKYFMWIDDIALREHVSNN